MLVGERPHFLAIDENGAHKLLFLHHWNRKRGSGARKLGKSRSGGDDPRIGAVRLVTDVGNLDGLFRAHRASQQGFGVRTDKGLAAALFSICWWGAMQCNHAQCVSFGQRQNTEFGLAQPRRVPQDGVENWLQVAR